MQINLPADWAEILSNEIQSPYFSTLADYVDAERASHTVYPPEADVFNSFAYSPLERTRVVILGQDPYHGTGQAHGLAFSVRAGVKLPPSLRNIFKELESDQECDAPIDGSLSRWAKQGVLLLNTVLTVREGEANSHKGKGWERFTDAVIRSVSAKEERVVFVLWGGPAQKKLPLIDSARHAIVSSPHPSPFSAYAGFFGSKPFSKVNEALQNSGQAPIDWCRL